MGDTIKMNTDIWSNAAHPVQRGSQDSNDISTDIIHAVNSLCDVLNTVGFMENSKLLITAMEDFGQGMIAALACVSVDLAVVASGLSAAAAAFSSLETELKNTFAQIDTQLGYFTNTTSSIALQTPTAADNAALNSFGVHPNTSDPGFSWSFPHITAPPPPPPAVGIVGILIIAGIIILSPVGI